MSRSLAFLRHKRPSRTTALVATAVAAVIGLTIPGAALAGEFRSVPAPPTSPTSAGQIQNIDQVKTAIKGYYGDQVDPQRTNPIDGSPIHTFNPDGSYAHEMAGLVANAEKDLARDSHEHGHHAAGTKAVLFDVDDTLLNTYSYEIYSNFVYNPSSNAAFVNSGVFHAVPHMVDLEKWAESKGYDVYFLTGRPEAQRAGTIQNLTNEGYDVSSSHLFLKDYGVDTWLSPCAPSCTTTQYKSLTRQHIESAGVDLVGNFGDQYSDLNGGFADHTFKVPNPMYYLP